MRDGEQLFPNSFHSIYQLEMKCIFTAIVLIAQSILYKALFSETDEKTFVNTRT